MVAHGSEASSFSASINICSSASIYLQLQHQLQNVVTLLPPPSLPPPQFVHDDINLTGLEEPVDDDLEPFTDLQLDSHGASCAASHADPPAIATAATLQ